MKQLLTWCASHALLEKKTNNTGDEGSARAVARVIQEELLKDFQNRAEISDWFNRVSHEFVSKD
jgi:kinetochore protein Mis13/DSN1